MLHVPQSTRTPKRGAVLLTTQVGESRPVKVSGYWADLLTNPALSFTGREPFAPSRAAGSPCRFPRSRGRCATEAFYPTRAAGAIVAPKAAAMSTAVRPIAT